MLRNSIRLSTQLNEVDAKTTVKIIEPFGKGLKEDLSRKLPFFISDFKDGFQLKTFSSTLFLFFACLAPAVAFGGMFRE